MAQPAPFSDVPAGEVQAFGSQDCIFTPPGGGTTQTLKCEEINYKKGTRAHDSNDAQGKFHKAAYVSTKGEGSMIVQIKSSTTRLTAGFTTSFLDTDGVTAIPVIVTEIGTRWQQNEITKISINIAEKNN